MKNLPKGTLRVSVDKGYLQYYRCLEGDKVGNYIRKQDKETARKLTQKEYNSKVLQLIQKRLKLIENIIRNYEDDEVEKCFYGEHAAKQKLIVPINDEDCVRAAVARQGYGLDILIHDKNWCVHRVAKQKIEALQ